MNKYILLMGVSMIMFIAVAKADSTMQIGAEAIQFNNTGMTAQIQTVQQQPIRNESTAAWIGDRITGNRFIQVGYEIPSYYGYTADKTCVKENALTGNLVDNDSLKTQYMIKNRPTIFWEWFNSSNYTCVYIDNSITLSNNQTYNYSIYEDNKNWSVAVNGIQLGTVGLNQTNG